MMQEQVQNIPIRALTGFRNHLFQVKDNEEERVHIEVSRIRKYFPKGYTARQMEESILQMLETRQKAKGREHG